MTVDRKKLIVDAAAKSFALFGYKATTMDQVAKIANVGKGTIYTFYTNKEELFKEIVSVIIREMKQEAIKAIDDDQPFVENLHQALYRLLAFRKEHQLLIKLFQEEKEIGTPAVRDMVEEIEGEIITFIKNKLEVAIEKGYIRPCDAEITAFIVLKMYVALIFDWEKNREPLKKEAIADLFKSIFAQGIVD
ncbi:TetR/AcrR family transcriptional regulator [Peribacillus psychrosaccharolyticus]